MRLAVELHGVHVGVLEGEARTFDFTPTSDGITHFGVGSTALSVAIPLTRPSRRDRAGRGTHPHRPRVIDDDSGPARRACRHRLIQRPGV